MLPHYTYRGINLLKALGAELVLTPDSEGMPGAMRKAAELAAETPDSFMPRQFDNPANPEVHRLTQLKKYGGTLKVRSIFSSVV
jgi:cysteine synthase